MKEKETGNQESEFDSNLTPEQQKKIKDIFGLPAGTQYADAMVPHSGPSKFAKIMAKKFNNVKRK